MVKKLNVLYSAAFITAVLIYSGLIKPKSLYNFSCLIKTEKIQEISGFICSNPVKKSGKPFYRLNFKTENCSGFTGETSTAKGIVQAFVPESCVEAFQPGKLYTKSLKTGGIICEQGCRIRLKGRFSGDIFICSSVEKMPQPQSFLSVLYRFRAILRLYLRRLMFQWGNAGGLFLALVSGIKEYTEDSVCTNFRKAGLSHILALSGMHLSLFSGISRKITVFVKNQKIQAVIQAFSVIFFVWFAGFSPSLYRALIFSLTGLSASILKCTSLKMTHTLCFGFLFHCITRPYDLMETSFMLSYGAIAGILILSQGIQFLTLSGMPVNISSSFSASSGAQFFTTPVTLKLMGTFAPIGIISTMIVSPFITLFIYSGIFLTILSLLFPKLAVSGAFLMNILYTVIEKIVAVFSCFPSISIS